jgi:hypothetical protein
MQLQNCLQKPKLHNSEKALYYYFGTILQPHGARRRLLCRRARGYFRSSFSTTAHAQLHCRDPLSGFRL